MDARRVAVVTGGNRGLGLAVCTQLAAAGLHVVLTAREVARGHAARRDLAARGLAVEFHQLDVTESASIRVLAAYCERLYGGADVLVNNAGVSIEPEARALLGSKVDHYRYIHAVNVLGPLAMCQAFVPLMVKRGYGRVVNVSSGMGQLSEMGAGSPAYRLSKAALNALTRTLAAEVSGSNVLVNSASPGWCRTDMGGNEAPRSAQQGADGICWLATLPDGGPTGGFFLDRNPIPW